MIQQVPLTCFGLFILHLLGAVAAMTFAIQEVIWHGWACFCLPTLLACFGMFWDMVKVSNMLPCFGMFCSQHIGCACAAPLTCLGMFPLRQNCWRWQPVLPWFGMFWDSVKASDTLTCFGMVCHWFKWYCAIIHPAMFWHVLGLSRGKWYAGMFWYVLVTDSGGTLPCLELFFHVQTSLNGS